MPKYAGLGAQVPGLGAQVSRNTHLVRLTTARALQQLLCGASPSLRVELIAEWSTSASALHREALARALGGNLDAVGSRSALELLSTDANAEVRRAVAEVAGLMPHPSPWPCLTVLRRLSLDSRPSVRASAIRSLGRTALAGEAIASLSALAKCARALDDETGRLALEEIRLVASYHPKDATSAIQEVIEHADGLDAGEIVLVVDSLRIGGGRHPLGVASLRRLGGASAGWVRDLALGALTSLEKPAGQLALAG